MNTSLRHQRNTTMVTRSRVACAWTAFALVSTAYGDAVIDGHKPATGPEGTS